MTAWQIWLVTRCGAVAFAVEWVVFFTALGLLICWVGWFVEKQAPSDEVAGLLGGWRKRVLIALVLAVIVRCAIPTSREALAMMLGPRFLTSESVASWEDVSNRVPAKLLELLAPDGE